MTVAGFSGHTDLTKAAEISNDVRRVVKNLKECQDLSVLYNQRERLFNLAVTQVHTYIIHAHRQTDTHTTHVRTHTNNMLLRRCTYAFIFI